MGRKKKEKEKVTEDPNYANVAKSFIFQVGNVIPDVKALRDDLRNVMKPYTATHLQERSSNEMKDFLSIAGLYGVSHFLLLSSTDFGSYLRLVKVPQGPTLTFRVSSFTLSSDLLAHNIKSKIDPNIWQFPPLVILNNFPQEEEHYRLTSTMLQNLFPAINVKEISIEDCTRVVIFSYDKESNLIEFRHYSVKTSVVGINKNIKKVIKSKIPDLSKLQDISDFVLGTNYGSDSEVEDSEENRVTLRDLKTQHHNQNAVRLTEVGPRMTLSLIKVEEGVCTGKVLYHQYVRKTPEEIAKLDKRKQQEKKLKLKRKREQEKNVKKKEKRPKGKRDDDKSSDDDEEWYKKEVGSESKLEE